MQARHTLVFPERHHEHVPLEVVMGDFILPQKGVGVCIRIGFHRIMSVFRTAQDASLSKKKVFCDKEKK